MSWDAAKQTIMSDARKTSFLRKIHFSRGAGRRKPSRLSLPVCGRVNPIAKEHPTRKAERNLGSAA
jgi:hypothetical protein